MYAVFIQQTKRDTLSILYIITRDTGAYYTHTHTHTQF